MTELACTQFVQDSYRDSEEYRTVQRVGTTLLMYLRLPDTQNQIREANRPASSSASIQSVFLEEAKRIGFLDESRGLFASYATSALRPDYFLSLGETGILLEVERGKTTINNMDLLDFWKCHLCEKAHYLFLLVPQLLRQNETMTPRKEYASVVKRMSTFFEPRNYTNVRGLHVFGY